MSHQMEVIKAKMFAAIANANLLFALIYSEYLLMIPFEHNNFIKRRVITP
jgi:hypothetical protein